MSSVLSRGAAVLTCLVLLGGGCTSSSDDTAAISARTESKGPWDGMIVLATSSDGLSFTKQDTLLERAGVPNLLRLNDGTLVLMFQYFSATDWDAFDVIAYKTSSDSGATWSEMNTVAFNDLPEPIDADKKPMDPTLVQTEDGTLRLYFTYHAKGKTMPALYSADAQSLTDDFSVNPNPALALSKQALLDPAVAYLNGMWHHYTWIDKSEHNIHSTSKDGVTFTQQDDVVLPMDFLGQVIATDGGLRFYGTTGQGIGSATSTDGSTWTMDTGTRIQGADPGVTQLADGTYLMAYTSMNFNE